VFWDATSVSARSVRARKARDVPFGDHCGAGRVRSGRVGNRVRSGRVGNRVRSGRVGESCPLRTCRVLSRPPPSPPRTNRTRRVLHPVLIGHASSSGQRGTRVRIVRGGGGRGRDLRPVCTGAGERCASGLYWGGKDLQGEGGERERLVEHARPVASLRALCLSVWGVDPGSAFRLWWSLGGKGAQGPGDVQSKAQSKAAALLRGEMLRFLYGETLWFLILLACITRRRCGASGFSAGATRPSRRGGGAGGADATSATRSEVGDQTCYFPEKERA